MVEPGAADRGDRLVIDFARQIDAGSMSAPIAPAMGWISSEFPLIDPSAAAVFGVEMGQHPLSHHRDDAQDLR